MFGSATMSVIVLYGLHSPASSSFAYAAAAVAFFLFGLQTPRTSPSRTPVQPSMWNFALKPEPMKPTPNGLVEGIAMVVWGYLSSRAKRGICFFGARIGSAREQRARLRINSSALSASEEQIPRFARDDRRGQ